MARDLQNQDVRPLFNALKVMYNAANEGANASSLTVLDLKRLIDLIHNNFNLAKNSYQSLVDSVGASEARNVIAISLEPTPADVGAALTTIQNAVISLLDDYEASIYGTGTPAFTYSSTLIGGVLSGGHVNVNVGSGALSAIQSRFSSLVTDLLLLAPVE